MSSGTAREARLAATAESKERNAEPRAWLPPKQLKPTEEQQVALALAGIYWYKASNNKRWNGQYGKRGRREAIQIGYPFRILYRPATCLFELAARRNHHEWEIIGGFSTLTEAKLAAIGADK